MNDLHDSKKDNEYGRCHEIEDPLDIRMFFENVETLVFSFEYDFSDCVIHFLRSIQ